MLEAENARRREIEESLRASLTARMNENEARFRLLVEGVKDYAIFLLDPTGRVATWNTGAERIKGYAASEIIGKHFSVFYPPDVVASGHCERELALAVQNGRLEDEGWRIKKDGSRFWANVVITALRDAAGVLVGFAKITRDQTDRLRAEQARVQLARIEEAQRRKDEFLAIMGHELRNPLGPLVTAAHMIRLRGGRATEREMTIIDRQLRQMTKLVSDLLDASRALRDKVDVNPKPIELGEILANAVDLASHLIEERSHHLVIDVPERGLIVEVDPERMAQVFGNVLNNAAKYTPSYGTIQIRAERRDRDVHVTIEDNGQGIASDMHGRIFELFTQGDQAAARSAGGLGVGLAVARKVVRAHKGAIWAESAGPGRGSRFTIRLPALPPRASASVEPPLPLSKAAKNQLRALLVDDNRDSVELMQELLEGAGYEARIALDGPSALRVFEEFRPDIVFLDIGLPTMSGYEVAVRMRAMPWGDAIPIIALTGYARDDDRARALESGFSDHLSKPLALGTLAQVLERMHPRDD